MAMSAFFDGRDTGRRTESPDCAAKLGRATKPQQALGVTLFATRALM
jgi:hypothetical protein